VELREGFGPLKNFGVAPPMAMDCNAVVTTTTKQSLIHLYNKLVVL